MTSVYKLVYFNLKALGEPLRLLFAYLKIPYEDHLIDMYRWEEQKHEFKWNQLPELHINGNKILTQSSAISRYLAKKHDPSLIPTDDFHAARCDEIVDAINDLRIKTKPYIISRLVRGKEKREQLLQEEFPRFLSNVSEIMIETKGDSNGDFLFGNKISWADFWIAHFTSSWEEIFEEPNLLKLHQALKSQQYAVFALPEIKEYQNRRHATLF